MPGRPARRDSPHYTSCQESRMRPPSLALAALGSFLFACNITPPDAQQQAIGCPSGQCNGAAFASQSVPPVVTAGTKFTAQVTLRNAGSTTWFRADDKGHYLGSQGPQDNVVWSTNRGWMDEGACIAPGDSYTFTLELTAPAEPGSYPMQWQMLEDAVEWFGATTPPVSIEVGDAAAGCERSSGTNA